MAPIAGALLLLLLLAARASGQGYWLDTNLVGGRSYALSPPNGTEVLHPSLLMNVSSGFTFEAWVFYQPTSGPFALLAELDTGNFSALGSCGEARDPSNTYAWAIYVDTSTAKVEVQLIVCLEGQNSTLSYTLESLQSLPLGWWTHVCVTFSAAEAINMYTNGSLENFLDVPSWNASGTPMLTTGNVSLFDGIGAVDEIRWWNYARTPSETRRDYCTRLNGENDNIVAYYDFDIGPNETNIIYDRSPYGNELYNQPPVPPDAFVVGQPPLCGSMNESSVVIALILVTLMTYVGGIAAICGFWFFSCRAERSRSGHVRMVD